jgi:uncharacterized protein with HEPN domain
MREQHPELLWRVIMVVGNVLRHSYQDVAEQQIWRTVVDDLPVLEKAIHSEIALIER